MRESVSSPPGDLLNISIVLLFYIVIQSDEKRCPVLKSLQSKAPVLSLDLLG